MAYTVERGDWIEIEYESESGEAKATHGRVEANYDNLTAGIHANSTGVKIKRGSGRTAHEIRLNNDGTLRCSPYCNANGRGENGRIISMRKLEIDA